MIYSISGKVSQVLQDSLVVDVQGVGFQVFVPSGSLTGVSKGELIHLMTYFVVREDSMTLYGFSTAEEREIFELMLSVSGIGPKLALTTLSTLNPEAIRRAVISEQFEVFNRVPGIGKKTAQKILLHLQDKVTDVEGLEPISRLTDADTEVMEALIALGYSVVEAQSAVQAIPDSIGDEVEERLASALRYFSS